MTMGNKRVAITGCTSGIGRAASLELARQGAQLTLFYRSQPKVDELCAEIEAAGGSAPLPVQLDMADLGSVRAAAQTLLERGEPLDVLLNNAGVINLRRRETVDGFEETLAVNHFAPFLLTGMLLPLLQRPAGAPGNEERRIVNVSSDAHKFVRDMGFDDMQALRGYRVFREYGRSKLANILFTRRLARRLEGRGVSVNCLHPGAVATSLGKQNGGVMGKLLPALLKPFFLSPLQGAQTSLYLCSSPDVSGVSGEYFVNCRAVAPKPWATDDLAAEKLWQYTEQSLGYVFPV